MKILHTVQRYAPDVGGSEEVIKQISEHLVARGHEVTVATSATPSRTKKVINGVKIAEFNCGGNIVEGIRGDGEAFKDFVRQSNFDVMLTYAAQIWNSDLVFDLLPSLKMKKVFVPCGYSRLNDPLFAQYFAAMPDVLRKFDAVLYHSGSYIDKQFADRHGAGKSVIIPNGSDQREFDLAIRGTFRARHRLGNKPIVLNVSNHSRLKGHDFFWNCVPRLKQLGMAPVLIGKAYHSWPKKWLKECYRDCTLKGARYGVPVLEHYTRPDTVEAFTDADIFLFGSKVECAPLVMYEAFASRTLFVSLNCGNVKDYADIAVIVIDEREALEVIEDYLQHPTKYQERIRKGYELYRSTLNWEAISLRYEQLYESLLKDKPLN